MKTFKRVSALSVVILLSASTFVQAQNFRSPYPGAPMNAGAPRTFLGLPLPQQWTGTRPASMNRYTGNSPAVNSENFRQPSPCATGNCSTGNCRTGNCVNGQCTTRRPIMGQTLNSNCANGQCGLNQYPATRSNSNRSYEAQGNWSPRTTRSNVADPFRGAEYENQNEQWMTRPGVRNPVDDLMPSRYNSNDLDLRRPYFNNQSGELMNDRTNQASSGSNNLRDPLPAKRSLIGAPADRADDLAQI